MDKTKAPPIPEKTTAAPKEEPPRKVETQQQSPDPTFVRGTIDPPTKK